MRRWLLLSSWLLLMLVCSSGIAGEPIPAPDLRLCQDDPSIPKCCPPVANSSSGGIRSFVNPTARLPVRLRRPAHQLDAASVAKLRRAYALMRALPASDPRSLEQQRRIHCAYCCALFAQPWSVRYSDGDVQAALQIHFGWLLFPWHRWFLYFHERILASLIHDDSLALPYWNWSNQVSGLAAGAMPAAYQVQGSSLYDAQRSVAHQPPAIANLSFNSELRPVAAQINSVQLREANLNLMHQVMVSAPTTRNIFFGQAYRAGAQLLPGEGPGQGLVEATVHNSVHDWTGDERNDNFEDMGALFVSGRDPIFYAHHAEIDRLWNVWKSRGGRDLDDPDFLNTQFLFYDETARLVRVTVSQGLDTVAQLRYTYQSVADADAQWLNYTAASCASPATSLEEWMQSVPMYQHKRSVAVTVAKPFTARFTRQPSTTSSSKTLSGGHEEPAASAEVLVFDGLKVDWTESAHFKVFVNLPTASAHTSLACAEFLGIFSNMANNVPAGRSKISFRLGIGNKLKQLGLESRLQIVVSVVPGQQHTSSSPIHIDTIRLALENV